MDRMTPLDAAFLQAEDEEPGVSLAIGSIAIFAGPPPGPGEFAAMLAGRLPLIPRYRQKARQVPLDLGPPVWVDDAHFDLDYHVRRTALPAPGGTGQLRDLMGRVMSARLDRDRPLWEYWQVEGLADGRWALISKLHHCMVDGISGTDLYRVVLDPTPEQRPGVPDDWRPEPEPSTVRLTADAVRELVRNPAGQLRAIGTAVLHPRELAALARDTGRGLLALAGALPPARVNSLSGPVSGHRRFTWTDVALADVKQVRAALGGTVNDVVLAAAAGGFRALLLARGEPAAADSVRTLVPVSVRTPGAESIRDNRVSLMLADLPVELTDPVDRLATVRARLAALKAAREAEAGAAVTAVAGIEPFPLIAATIRLAAHLPQRSIVTVTTNVPGPRVPLYALGRRLEQLIGYVPIASTLRIGVSIVSYLDRIAFGITADADAAPDLDVLATGIAESMAQLVAAARAAAPAADGQPP